MINIYTLNIDDLYGTTSLSSHMEDYVETIAILSEKNKVVRVKDIAAELKIKMPSVTSALNKLKEMGLIEYEKYGYIELTPAGDDIARLVLSRHICLKEFFHHVLNIDEHEAETEACKIEHHITAESCRKIHKLLLYYKSEHEAQRTWTEELSVIMKNA